MACTTIIEPSQQKAFYRVLLPAARQTPQLGGLVIRTFQLSPQGTASVWNDATPVAEGGSMSEKWPRILPKVVTSTSLLGSFTCRNFTTWDRRLQFPSEGRRTDDFFRPKNPTASAGFEPANLGTKGQHATSKPPKPLFYYTARHNFSQLMVDNMALGQMGLWVLWWSHVSIILSQIHTHWFMYYWCFIILATDSSALKTHYYWCLKVENQLCTVKNLLATSLEKSASEQQQLELELSATREKVAEVQSQLLLAEQVGCNWITFNVVNIHSVKRNRNLVSH